MNEKLERALDSTLTKLKAYGIFSMPVTAAIDKHKLPRYDEGIECFLTRGKKDRSTTKFETYATLQSVEEGRRAQIACEHVDFFDEEFDGVQRLLTGAKLNDVSFSLILAYREFFSCKTIHVLKKYISFATNIPKGKIVWNVTMIPKDYRRRWGIESAYIGIEEFRARTTSRNHTLRLLYFFYAKILYNAWLLANLMLAKRFSRILTLPMISIELQRQYSTAQS